MSSRARTGGSNRPTSAADARLVDPGGGAHTGTDAAMSAPALEGDARKAVLHRGSHLQIIASAGSGKTEVVAQRVASLLADGVPALGIVAFTFTERAAAELKHRIAERVEESLGEGSLDLLGTMFVGTIHAYCFRMLQARVPRYETYDVLDEKQLNAFLAREANRLGIKALDPKGQDRVWASIERFLHGIDVVENELLDPDRVPDPLGSILVDYLAALERYRLLTFGQQIVRAVAELEIAEVADAVHADLQHLIVDEYQDVNPAQERLINLLAGPGVELCVVGDDDQAIYQWRGSNVDNITSFSRRYPGVQSFSITTNRRSVPAIVTSADAFAQSIPGRLPKTMRSAKPDGGGTSVAVWSLETELDEAGQIANTILDLNDDGVPFADMAVLVRSRAAYPHLREQFATFGIPVQPGGRTGLFDQPEACLVGQTIVWLTGLEWRMGYEKSTPVVEKELIDQYLFLFDLPAARTRDIRKALQAWKDKANGDSPANLVGELYDLLDLLDVRSWGLDDPFRANRLGTLARLTALLADYESVRRRARADEAAPGEQVGGQDRGTWYYRNLGTYILNYATGAYEGFDGEEDVDLDAVDLTTIHRAKGLEWPVVFVPSLTARRFPSTRAGQERDWPLPRTLFDAARYEGSDAEERRLFYVALTRARDLVSVSRHDTPKKQRVRPSPYWEELAAEAGVVDDGIFTYPAIESVSDGDPATLELTYSDLSSYLDCAMAYGLRGLLGFQPRLAPELGYGKAVHHVLRTVAEHTRAKGRLPTPTQVESILDESFFLPAANKPAHRNLKAAARRLVDQYVAVHPDDLHRVWETERPFELHLDGVTVSGRADVILDQEDGIPTALAILDYKTSTRPDDVHDLQLQVYADAGRREGLDVRGAYVHDLKGDARTVVDVGEAAVTEAERLVQDAAVRIRSRDYTPSPGKQCRTCEVRTVCGSATHH